MWLVSYVRVGNLHVPVALLVFDLQGQPKAMELKLVEAHLRKELGIKRFWLVLTIGTSGPWLGEQNNQRRSYMIQVKIHHHQVQWMDDTVDGSEIRHPPVDMEHIPLFTVFYTSQVVIALNIKSHHLNEAFDPPSSRQQHHQAHKPVKRHHQHRPTLKDDSHQRAEFFTNIIITYVYIPTSSIVFTVFRYL